MPKKKRCPSGYNEFIGACMKKVDLKGKPFGAAAPFMKQCSATWKELTDKEKENWKQIAKDNCAKRLGDE